MADQPEMNEDELLRRALALSLAETQGSGTTGVGGVPTAVAAVSMGGGGGGGGSHAMFTSASALAPWDCAACTFSNAGPLRQCEICGSPHPAPPAVPTGRSGGSGGGGGGDSVLKVSEEERLLQEAIARSISNDEDAELRRVLELSKMEK